MYTKRIYKRIWELKPSGQYSKQTVQSQAQKSVTVADYERTTGHKASDEVAACSPPIVVSPASGNDQG